MSEKTVSQKIARAFEIADYVLMIPALFGLFYGSILLFFGLPGLTFALGVWLLFGFGTWLMVGYIKHSRGKYDDRQALRLWIGTIVYNSILLLGALFFGAVYFRDITRPRTEGEIFPGLVVYLPVLFAYLAAVGLGVKAYLFEKNQKYL